MAKRNMITVKDVNIWTIQKDGKDYISLTDIAKQKNVTDPNGVIGNWMRNRNTIEYLGLWETLHNPNFNPLEFEGFRRQAGLNAFTLSPTQWREANPDLKGNIRDYATINELICLANMENLNSVLINDGVPQGERLVKLNQIAIHQMQVLEDNESRKLLKAAN
jgi:hypothetical protein